MRHRLWLMMAGFICLIGSAISAFYAKPGTPESPQKFLAVVEVLDVGEHSQGETVDAQFELVNNLRKPIEILGTAESCGCSVIELGAQKLAPSERTSLKVKWRLGAARGKRHVTIIVNYRVQGAGKMRSLKLALFGTIVPDVIVDPASLEFAPEFDAEKSVTIAPGLWKSLVIESAYASHRSIGVARSSENRITVRFDSSQWDGPEGFVPEVIIRNNSPNEPYIHIPVTIRKVQKPVKSPSNKETP